LNLRFSEKEPFKFIESLAIKLALTAEKKGKTVLPNKQRVAETIFWVKDKEGMCFLKFGMKQSI
jgi:hypothetical protein